MYLGYLIKVGGAELPLEYFKAGKYKITPNMRQDIEPFRNGNGVLTRKVATNKPSKIEIETMELTSVTLPRLMGLIRSNYLNEDERKVSLTYYCPDLDDYKTAEFYMPDIVFPINTADEKMIKYDSFTIKFIGY